MLENGFFTLELDPETPGLQGFAESLEAESQAWFESMLQSFAVKPVQEKVGAGHNAARVTEQSVLWHAASTAEKQDSLRAFTLKTREGRVAALTNEGRRRATADMPFGDYVRYLVQSSKQGGCVMALGRMHVTWADSGFGLWSHVVPSVGLHIAVQVAEALAQKGFDVSPHDHYPHVIYKHEGSAGLRPHHDQITPSALVDALKAHLASEDPSNLAWARKHGLQLLAHLEGGVTEESGATFVVGPMSCPVLLLCMEHFEAQNDSQQEGPYFYDWKQQLPALNVMLKENGYEKLRFLPISPPNASESTALPFVAAWPVGFPHGSFKNKGKRRITVTVPLDVARCKSEDDLAVQEWAGELGSTAWLRTLANCGENRACRKDAELILHMRKLRLGKEAFADGLTHKRPISVLDLMGPSGWFANLRPSSADVAIYARRLLQTAEASASLE